MKSPLLPDAIMRRLFIASFLVTSVVPAFGLAAASYQEGSWKIVDAMDAGLVQAMTADQARPGWVGRTQEFVQNSVRGPFLECRDHNRVTETHYLADIAASADQELREGWFQWGVTLSGTGVFVVSMKCGIPGTNTYDQVEFLQTGDNQTAYFGRDGVIFRTKRIP